MNNDITMCCSIECPKRMECYRFLAIPDYIQSYADFQNTELKDCFIQATKQEKEIYEQKRNGGSSKSLSER